MSPMQEVLEEVFAGDMSLEAGAVVDKLADRGYALVPFGVVYDLRLPRRRWWPFARAAA